MPSAQLEPQLSPIGLFSLVCRSRQVGRSVGLSFGRADGRQSGRSVGLSVCRSVSRLVVQSGGWLFGRLGCRSCSRAVGRTVGRWCFAKRLTSRGRLSSVLGSQKGRPAMCMRQRRKQSWCGAAGGTPLPFRLARTALAALSARWPGIARSTGPPLLAWSCISGPRLVLAHSAASARAQVALDVLPSMRSVHHCGCACGTGRTGVVHMATCRLTHPISFGARCGAVPVL